MRIIKEGIIPNLEYIFVCPYCKCEFAVNDFELHTINPYIDKNAYRCPCCGTPVYGYTIQEIEEETPADSETNETDGS